MFQKQNQNKRCSKSKIKTRNVQNNQNKNDEIITEQAKARIMMRRIKTRNLPRVETKE